MALVRTDVSGELSAYFIRVARIGELGTTLMKEALSSSETSFLQEPHGVTSQKTPFSMVTAVKASNLTQIFAVQKVEFPTLLPQKPENST
jgi:hypothetical protein